MSRSVKYVIGPDGSPLSVADLPCVKTIRWTVARKGAVVAGVQGGLISLAEACARYRLTVDEFGAWAESYARHGLAALRTTRVQQYRT